MLGAGHKAIVADLSQRSFDWSRIRGVALGDDRLMAVGSWITEVDGELRLQGYALGLNLDGSLACLTTLDGVDIGVIGGSVLPTAIEPSAMGFRVAGFTTSADGVVIDLLQAHIR